MTCFCFCLSLSLSLSLSRSLFSPSLLAKRAVLRAAAAEQKQRERERIYGAPPQIYTIKQCLSLHSVPSSCCCLCDSCDIAHRLPPDPLPLPHCIALLHCCSVRFLLMKNSFLGRLRLHVKTATVLRQRLACSLARVSSRAFYFPALAITASRPQPHSGTLYFALTKVTTRYAGVQLGENSTLSSLHSEFATKKRERGHRSFAIGLSHLERLFFLDCRVGFFK